MEEGDSFKIQKQISATVTQKQTACTYSSCCKRSGSRPRGRRWRESHSPDQAAHHTRERETLLPPLGGEAEQRWLLPCGCLLPRGDAGLMVVSVALSPAQPSQRQLCNKAKRELVSWQKLPLWRQDKIAIMTSWQKLLLWRHGRNSYCNIMWDSHCNVLTKLQLWHHGRNSHSDVMAENPTVTSLRPRPHQPRSRKKTSEFVPYTAVICWT